MDSSCDARGSFACLLGLMALLLACPVAAQPVALTVQEAYLELHSGPGRGYPVFYVVERGAEVELLLRRTDWYKLRTGRRTEGWVHRDQLTHTLRDVDPGLRAAVLDRYLDERLGVGLSAGVLESDPLLRLYGDYRLSERYSAELGIAQVSGTYSSSRLYELGVLIRPWPRLRWVPHLSLGAGYISNAPRNSLIDTNRADGAVYGAGLGLSRWLSPRIGVRADWRYRYADFDGGDEKFQAFTAGFGLHF